MRIEAVTLLRPMRFDVSFAQPSQYGVRRWLVLQVVGLACLIAGEVPKVEAGEPK